jgi:hypothetical protein
MMQACGAFGMEAFLHLVLLRRSLRPEQRAIWITPRKILCEVGIERDYQELKQELGLGHYEGRVISPRKIALSVNRTISSIVIAQKNITKRSRFRFMIALVLHKI